MTEFTDRLLLLVVAGTALAVLVVGWVGGFVQAELSGVPELAMYGVIAVVFLGIMAGIWREFDRVD